MRGVALAVVCLSVPAADAADHPTPNAALLYWHAFAAMPGPKGSGDKLTEDEQKRVDEWETAPLDEATGRALKKHADALAYLHRGAAIAYCLWGSQLDLRRDGIGTRCPQVASAHGLRHAALLRARYRFANGQAHRAVDDLFALLQFARHLDVGSSLIGVLVGFGIERDVIRVLASHMWVLAADADLLTATKAKWVRLPPARPMVDALREERDGFLGMIRRHAVLDPNDQPDDEIGTPIGFIPTLGFLLGSETVPQSVATLCDTVERHTERLIQATAVSPEKIAAAEEAFYANWDKDTAGDDLIAAVVARTFLPAVGNLRRTEAEMQTRRAMLCAALAVAEGGSETLKANPDPFGNTPFKTRPIGSGYEMTSALGTVIDKPLVLLVRTAKSGK
ncbi:hypothetical protein [Frigoriglobus tundricola]|uniref:Uncharacterized protein n=1 Tax=Frigoriglobus tundricola TaxID=2774151 RepID=A0A6M5Z6E0_9BACT|nr:hypothetical protein [Frigoriglobus tundricola]QJX00961.1 hypothetical protein FTUN_8599 [Frigoriglobus tundricola]